MNIQEERAYILSENNTAQKRVIDVLETMVAATATELHLIDELSGDIDFSILNSLGFNKIKTINLGDGKITSISHIPNTVSKFKCTGNILIALNLPKSIVELNCSDNHINELDLTGIHSLVKLNCSNNEIDKLENIPENIQEIICDNNNITLLNLNGLTSLKKLHCSHNKLMIIQNLPIQLEDFKMDNNPMAIIEHIPLDIQKKNESPEIKIDYIEGLNEYFKLKQKYDLKVYEMKKKAFLSTTNKKKGKLKAASIKPLCINCSRNVGTIFNKQNEAYTAICGDMQSPCNLNIKIYNGYYNDLETLLYGMKDEFDDSKNAIIIQKIKTIFNYLSDSQSANLFKKELSNYNDISSLYKIVLDVYDQIYNNMHKKELIIRKNEEIYELLENIKMVLNEYTTTNNIELLKTAVQMQHDDLIPKIEFLRRLKYEIMEMNSDKNGMIHLIQNPVPLSKIVYSYDEPSNIVKFTK